MSEKTNEPVTETTKESTETEASKDKTCCKGGSCCGANTPLVISVIALLLAGYAAFTAISNADTSAIDKRLNDLNSQISGVNDQIANLNHEMETNRETLIQTKLKKALQSIQEIGSLAGKETRATITEVEQMLQTLTSVGEQLDSSAQPEPVTTPPAAEPAPEQETSPAVAAPAETTPEASAPAEAPTQPATNTEQPTAAETPAKQTAPAPADAAPANAAPTDAAPAADTSELQTGSTPATETSTPQAF